MPRTVKEILDHADELAERFEATIRVSKTRRRARSAGDYRPSRRRGEI
ncbi:MAG: hypothetical protein ACR2IP_04840 [Solirubrobacteraceae bacterium]